MSPTKAEILAAVNASPNGITTAELADKLGGTRYSISGTVSKLATYGFIDKVERGGTRTCYTWKPKTKNVAAALILLLAAGFSSHAHAKAHHHRHHHARHWSHSAAPTRAARHSRRAVHFSDGRPSAWCGWYMRRLLGVHDASFNLARNWAHYGSPAAPAEGIIVVWPHHVGIIRGRARNGQWLVESGNDGHAVRTRPRSLAGAIAFRRA